MTKDKANNDLCFKTKEESILESPELFLIIQINLLFFVVFVYNKRIREITLSNVYFINYNIKLPRLARFPLFFCIINNVTIILKYQIFKPFHSIFVLQTFWEVSSIAIKAFILTNYLTNFIFFFCNFLKEIYKILLQILLSFQMLLMR